MIHFLNVTYVLTNRVNCSGSTFNLTLFWRVVRDLRALLAICFACSKFYQYIYGKQVDVQSDHKPLEVILKKPIAKASPRVQRMMLRLQRYNLNVRYTPGKEMYLADTLSRAYIKGKPDSDFEDDIEIMVQVILSCGVMCGGHKIACSVTTLQQDQCFREHFLLNWFEGYFYFFQLYDNMAATGGHILLTRGNIRSQRNIIPLLTSRFVRTQTRSESDSRSNASVCWTKKRKRFNGEKPNGSLSPQRQDDTKASGKNLYWLFKLGVTDEEEVNLPDEKQNNLEFSFVRDKVLEKEILWYLPIPNSDLLTVPQVDGYIPGMFKSRINKHGSHNKPIDDNWSQIQNRIMHSNNQVIWKLLNKFHQYLKPYREAVFLPFRLLEMIIIFSLNHKC